jgi:hypothetical protein
METRSVREYPLRVSLSSQALRRWCAEEASIDNMNDLTGRKLQDFKTWRRDEYGLKPITLCGQLDVLRIFLRWC